MDKKDQYEQFTVEEIEYALFTRMEKLHYALATLLDILVDYIADRVYDEADGDNSGRSDAAEIADSTNCS